MNSPGFGIAWIMALVAAAALNFGAPRALNDFKRTGINRTNNMLDALGLGSLPMANVLAAGILIGRRRGVNRASLLGFAAFGAAALALSILEATFLADGVVIPYLRLVLDPW